MPPEVINKLTLKRASNENIKLQKEWNVSSLKIVSVSGEKDVFGNENSLAGIN